MPISKKFTLALAFLSIFCIHTNTIFAQDSSDTPNPETTIRTIQEWDSMSGSEKEAYCRETGNSKDPKCRAIFNEDGECYYTNVNDSQFDRSNNCIIEGNRELCLRDKFNKVNECITNSNEDQDANSSSLRQYCEDQFICRSSSPVAEPRNSESGIPYDSEYFNINDEQSGLVAPNQTTFNTNANGGPIIGTVNKVIDLMVSLIGIFALLVFIVGAIFLITANGDDNKIQKGKGAMKYALVGIVFVMMSYTIVVLVQSILF